MRRKRHTIHGCHRICRSIRHLQYRTRRSDITTLVGFANDSVSSTDSDVEPGDYTVARRGKNKRPINSVLLTMLDVDEARRIAVNEAYRTVAFTWNAIRHLLLVPEDQIVRPEPSILLPKTTSNTTMTQNLSALLVLAQDETFNDEARQESSAERHARSKRWNDSSSANSISSSPASNSLSNLNGTRLPKAKPSIVILRNCATRYSNWNNSVEKPLMKMRNSLNTSAHCIRKTSVWTYCSPSVKPYWGNTIPIWHALICSCRQCAITGNNLIPMFVSSAQHRPYRSTE